MKCVIYYFSGTGNNLAIAKQLAEELENTEVFPISCLEKEKSIPDKYDWIGFCVPSYYSHVPPYVEECLKNVRYARNQRIFTVIGCGGNRGMAVQDLRKRIAESGKETDQEYMVMLPGNYILSYQAFPLWYQSLTIYLSHQKIRRIARNIRARKHHKPLGRGIFYNKRMEPELQAAIAGYAETGKGYTISEECIGCGICVKLCPVGNLTIEDGKVVVGNHCNQCMGCIQWCPKKAIDFKGKAAGRRKYHHPDVTVGELFQR